MTFIDFFAGIGGFHQGMERAGHKCVGFCEYDKYAVQAYNAMYDTKELYYAKDIRAINPSDLPEADCWCAGIPCQAFSVAGKRRGFEDMRGTLVFEVFRLAAERHPRILFLENVAGLLNHDGGRTFATILFGLWELGYDVQWQLLNSKNHGVPQNRERVFIIGYSGTGCRPQVFPIIEESNRYSTVGKSAETAIANTFTAGGHSGGNRSGMTIIAEREQYEQGIKQLNDPTHSNDRVYDAEGLSPTLNTMQGGLRQPFIVDNPSLDADGNVCAIDAHYYKGHGTRGNKMRALAVQPVLTPDREEKRQNGRRFKEDGEPMFTLTGQDRHGVMLRPVRTEYGKEIRKQYEAGEVEESRHNMTRLEPRPDDISNTLTGIQKDNLLYVKEATKQGYAIAEEGDSINLAVPNSQTRRGRVGKGIANTVDTGCQQGVMVRHTEDGFHAYRDDAKKSSIQGTHVTYPGGKSHCLEAAHNPMTIQDARIRRLTPLETWRLQGFPDECFYKAKYYSVNESREMFERQKIRGKHQNAKRQFTNDERIERISDSQLYKMAGNAVTVNVIEAIARRLSC